MIGAFSKDSERCRKCIYYKDCDEKRMGLCAYIIPDKAAEDAIVEAIMQNSLSLTNYEIGRVDTQAILENVHKEMEKVCDPVYWEIRRSIHGENSKM